LGAILNEPREESVDDFAIALRRNWRVVLGAGLIGSALTLSYTFLIPAVYRAESVLLIPTSTSPALPGGPTQVNILRGLALSRPMLENIAKDVRSTPEKVEDKLDLKADGAKSQLVMAAQTATKAESLAIVSSMSKWIEPISSSASLTPAGRRAAELKETMETRKEELKEAEAKVAEFSSKAATQTNPEDPSGIVEYRQQLRRIELAQGEVEIRLREAKGRAKSAGQNTSLPSDLTGTIEARQLLLDAQVAYEIANRKLGGDNPERIKAKAALDAAQVAFQSEVRSQILSAQEGLSSDIATMEAERLMLGIQADFWRNLTQKAPDEAIKLMRLSFEVESLAGAVKLMEKKYSMALQESEVEGIRWSVLQPPTALPDPINKDFGLNGALGLGLGLFVGSLFAVRTSNRK
jgi:uncharacterized protein involved in exopolysaccharide biosynthesis